MKSELLGSCPKTTRFETFIRSSVPRGGHFCSSTAVLQEIPHSNCSKRVPNRPLRDREGRFGPLLQQLECGILERTTVERGPLPTTPLEAWTRGENEENILVSWTPFMYVPEPSCCHAPQLALSSWNSLTVEPRCQRMHTFHRARVAPRVVHGGPYWWMWGTPRAQTWLRQFAESDWTASDLVEVGTPLLHSLRLRSSRHRRRNRTGWSIGAIQRCCLRWSDGTARAGPRTSVSSITVYIRLYTLQLYIRVIYNWEILDRHSLLDQ